MIHLFVHQLIQQVNQQVVTGVETMVMTMVFPPDGFTRTLRGVYPAGGVLRRQKFCWSSRWSW
jgi:hypothetical protein